MQTNNLFFKIYVSHWDRYLGMMTAMTQVPVPTTDNVSYSKWDSDIQKRSGSHDKVGERNRNYFAVMPAIKWYWTNKNSFGLYSKAAVGAAFLSSTEKDFATNKSKDDNSTYFMFQASLIGAEFGKQFRGFAELGVGEQGFLLAGIRYKF